MKGKYGTSMSSIEYRPQKKGVHCKDCAFLTFKGGVQPYFCTKSKDKKKSGRYYSSVVRCSKFVSKNSPQIRVRKKSDTSDIALQ